VVRLLLPSRASEPEHCRECDGPRDTDGPLCAECDEAPLLQRIEWRYQNGEGITALFDNDRWRLMREFHPLAWGLGVDIEFSHASASICVTAGPWSLWAGWSA